MCHPSPTCYPSAAVVSWVTGFQFTRNTPVLWFLPQPRCSLGSGSLSHGRGSGDNFCLCPDSVVSLLIPSHPLLILVSASTGDPTYLSTPTLPLATVLRETRGSQPLLLDVCPSHFHSMPGWRWEKLFRSLIPRGAARAWEVGTLRGLKA